MGPSIQPCIPPAHDLHIQLRSFQIALVDVSDLQLATRGRLDICRDVAHLVVVEIKTGHCIMRSRLDRLFFQRQGSEVLIKLHHPISFRVVHVIGEDRRAFLLLGRPLQLAYKIMAMEDVVAKDQRGRIIADKVAADDERLRQPVWRRLYRILQVDPPLASVAEHVGKARCVFRRRDNQDVPNPCQHQRGQRIVDHRLVVNRQQLLRNRSRDRIQAGTGSASEDNALAHDDCQVRIWSSR
ncbi:hypothetical protein D9M72_434000 [compost metagenome]